jgi:hypothetical protein
MPEAHDHASTSALTLDRLAATSGGLGAVVARTATTLTFDFALMRADGGVSPYRLVIKARGTLVEVQEAAPLRLPAACPDRHINFGGGFCMNWQDGEPLLVADSASAELWWDTLQQYLRKQEVAERLRRWPDRGQWAHGEAARHQRQAEHAAAALGADYLEDLRSGRLSVGAERRGFLTLLRGGRRAYAVWRQARRVATLRQACFCGSGRTLRDCHRIEAAELVFALIAWPREEARFWASMKDQPCCGTLEECELKKGRGPAQGAEGLAA